MRVVMYAVLILMSLNVSGAEMDKFEWQASENGPKGYPMQIVSGSFYYHDGTGSLNVPDGSTLDNGWAVLSSTDVVGPKLKPLPNKISLTFFSYTENQFYSGDFKLPYEKILKLFQDGYDNPAWGKHVTYDVISVGVAPGGSVAVWLKGLNRTKEVFFGRADKIEGNWKWIVDNPDITRSEFINVVLNESIGKKGIEEIKKNGIPFGRWEHYHETRYHWQPEFTNIPLYENRIDEIEYYNGEDDFMIYPLSETLADESRAVPKFFDFTWDRPHSKPLRIELTLDEQEIFKDFEILGKEGQPLKLEMRLSTSKTKGEEEFTVWLHDKDKEMQLKKLHVETYGIPEHATN